MKDYQIIVQKFGGSSVASAEKIKAIASFIKEKLKNEEKICVVVSAMGKTTDNLLKLAHGVALSPKERELDMLISCGERSSMALLAMALLDQDIKAISLTGSQSGIITDNNHRNAEIIHIKPDRIFSSFKDYDVVIVAGFQGVSLNKEITTLRRGGSDTTAVALAKALSAKYLEIYSDVPGVLSTDPNIVKNAITLPEITFNHMTDMALYGAKVLAYEACLIAENYQVPFISTKTLDDSVYTKVDSVAIKKINKSVIGITHVLSIVKIAICEEILKKINQPILLIEKQEKNFIAYLSNDYVDDTIKPLKKGLGLITIHCEQNTNILGVLNQIFPIISKLSLDTIVIANRHIHLVLDDFKLKEVLNILHGELYF